MACTDSLAADGEEKAPWEERKLTHIEKVRHASHEVAMVTAADKLHNLTSMLRDVKRDGPETMQRFKRPDRVIWYYSAMADALEPHSAIIPLEALRASIVQLQTVLKGRPDELLPAEHASI